MESGVDGAVQSGEGSGWGTISQNHHVNQSDAKSKQKIIQECKIEQEGMDQNFFKVTGDSVVVSNQEIPVAVY